MGADFFELPVGDQHRECIEVETDYDRGVMDERKRWEAKPLGNFTNEQLMEELSERGLNNDDFDEFIDDYNNTWGD